MRDFHNLVLVFRKEISSSYDNDRIKASFQPMLPEDVL